ncbi:PAS domain S-box protein [Trinickia diaoshuihuensis]|uniref:PAS domain S-box protein n=1 Tax=Trinickia diaoshuihuensis TaxID=2292265 RepID=UPI00196778D9
MRPDSFASDNHSLSSPPEPVVTSEERLRILLESVQDYAIYLLDTDGCIVSWNSGAEKIKGYTAQEVLGKHFSMFYPPDDRRCWGNTSRCSIRPTTSPRVRPRPS